MINLQELQTSMQMPIPTSLAAEAGNPKWFLAGQVEEGKAPNQLAGNMRPTRLPPFMVRVLYF